MTETEWRTDQELAADDKAFQDRTYADQLDMDVAKRARQMKVDRLARAKVDAELTGDAPPFDAGTLAEILARPAEPPRRVEDLIPSEAGTLIVASRKTGKTTLQLNLARSLIRGSDFLGRFPTRPVSGNVGLLNFEVSAAMLAGWADQHRVPRDRLYLVNLRGRRNPFSHEADLEQLAADLRRHEIEALIVDPFGRAYPGQSQNDPGEVSAWLAQLDYFARSEAGITDLVLAAHAGWNGERTRGASALEDWADSIVNLVRDQEDDQLRFLRAEGRDVLVEEDRLVYDPATKTLTLAGDGSRKATAKKRQVDTLVDHAVKFMTDHPGSNGTRFEEHLRDQGITFQRGDERRALRAAIDRGLLEWQPGKGTARNYHPTGSLPDPPQTLPMGDLEDPPQPLPIQGEGLQASPTTTPPTGEAP